MKQLIVFVSLALGLVFLSFLPKQHAQEPVSATFEPIAVVELFTSQGCSSCPPADRVLSGLVDRSEKKDQAIYALSFHVDYWNYLGWKDPYSDAAYSARQEQYGESLGIRLYTPQMLVNGQGAFVGSRKVEAEGRIEKALSKAATVGIKLVKKAEKPQDMLEVNYTLSEYTSGWVLNVALVERNLKDAVKRGENRGRTLSHDNVVREFQVLPLKGSSGSIQIATNSISDRTQTSLITYIQNESDMKILGASKLDL
ncbi:MAG: DUF1223 domain-containing protein [Bacteroidota bacterium]